MKQVTRSLSLISVLAVVNESVSQTFGMLHSTASIQEAVSAWCDDTASASVTYGHISQWNTQNVLDMSDLFKKPEWGGFCASSATFNDDIASWHTSKVTNMREMFAGCQNFDMPLNWDVSRVTDMAGMFYGTKEFNQPLLWDVSSCENMEGMFQSSAAFNQEVLSGWNVEKVRNMDGMFNQASSFSHELAWSTEGKETLGMFVGAGGGSTNEEAPQEACAVFGTYYSDEGACKQCAAGTTSRGKVKSCVSCPAGLFARNGECAQLPQELTPRVREMPTSPAPSPTAPPTGTCFHGDELVTLEGGALLPISEVRVGDRIQTADKFGNLSFAPVVSLPHDRNDELVAFLALTTMAGKTLELTPDHLIPRCSRAQPTKVVTARTLRAGDCVLTVDGREEIGSIAEVEKRGVYTAITDDKFIVVNSVVASPFSQDRDLERDFQQMQRRLARKRDRRKQRKVERRQERRKTERRLGGHEPVER